MVEAMNPNLFTAAQKDKALGAIAGAFIGDAAGGPLEFSRGSIPSAKVKAALKFQGGGKMNLAPG